MTDKERIEALAAALRYALTKRGSAFDYDVWSEMARKALVGLPDSTSLDTEMAVNAKLRQALDTVRAERDALKARSARHDHRRSIWAIAGGQLLWCYRCGAWTHNVPNPTKEQRKWHRPTGPNGPNPAMRGK